MGAVGGVEVRALLIFLLLGGGVIAGGPVLPGTGELSGGGDLAAEMVDGIGRFLDREIAVAVDARASCWARDVSSAGAYAASVEPNRRRFARIVGAVDAREPARLEVVAGLGGPKWVAEGAGYRVFAVRWGVFRDMEGEGLLLEPNGRAAANVVALPDCDVAPEHAVGLEAGLPVAGQFPRRLAEAGCRVLVPLLMDRRDTYSGNASIKMTNQPHREFLYRALYEMGRHVIGLELQKVLAAVDWFALRGGGEGVPIGVVGYGEGGLLALYAAALDQRIAAAVVSGYFGPREGLWGEPIYRNVWGLLREFGDAEIAGLVAPRALVVEASPQPSVAGPPAPSGGRAGAAPGAITTPDPSAVEAEWRRAERQWAGLGPGPAFRFFESDAAIGDAALAAFLEQLGAGGVTPAGAVPVAVDAAGDATSGAEARFKRQFDQMVGHTQRLMREGELRRREFWARAKGEDPSAWAEGCRWYREYFRDEVIGGLVPPSVPAGAQSRRIFEEPKYEGFEYRIGVHADVFASGILLVPRGMSAGERRPVVVCQHGLEGRPRDCADPSVDHKAYRRFACALAERGFIACAPQNPYVGRDAFRVLQRKANPMGKSLFSFIVQQHERLLEWLGGVPFVDRERIAFYGLSYGGKSAMRVPALVEGYCLSICSGDFNEWIWKNCSVDHGCSYLFTGEYEMPEFDLGNTFNYADMSWLICPRPFMVERGHHDRVAPDEWVAYEFAKTARRYALLGIGDRAKIEFFDGPHAIHGKGTFEFLHRHLDWPPIGRPGTQE